MYGPVAMRIAENWPMVGSLDELSAYAESKGGGYDPDRARAPAILGQVQPRV